MNIANCFGRLIMRIQPTEVELSSARQHLYVIKNRLTATFKINRFIPGGSLSRETYIRGQSDVDLFAVISRSDVTWGDKWVSSTTTLNNIRDALAYRYPKTPVSKGKFAGSTNTAARHEYQSGGIGKRSFSPVKKERV